MVVPEMVHTAVSSDAYATARPELAVAAAQTMNSVNGWRSCMSRSHGASSAVNCWWLWM